MENNYTFSFDERIDYALDCQDLLYRFLEENIDLYFDECEQKLLQYKLRTKSLATGDISLALGCIDHKIKELMKTSG